MNNFNKCPVCTSREIENRPEPINGRQDIMYICGNSIAYPVDNPHDVEETGSCENKIEWEHIYVDYGGEFDESAKFVDNRFYGWIELEFYREVHVANNWSNFVNFMDKQFLDEYFENKELYIKRLREQSNNLNPEKINIIRHNLYSNPPEKLVTIVKNYNQEPFVGKFVVKEKKKFNRDEYNVILFEIVSSEDKPELIGSYILEEVCDNFKKNRITLYEKYILDIILEN
jgi:hypothetical protein